MLPSRMVEIRYYVASGETAPFADWFAELDPIASAKVTRALARMEQGNFSNVKSVGEACWNTRSISGRATGFILGETATGS
jgi:putative component of toxin-antitoxin plasmid stabilization module